MGMFDKIRPPVPAPVQDYELLEDVSFSCQTCFEQVDEARYYRSMKLLVWKCSNGHKSFIEDFNI